MMQDSWLSFMPTYNSYLVTLSIIVACIAASSAFFINDQVKRNTLLSNTTWLMLAATTLGAGIWAVHFIGMVAMQLPVAMTYNKILTIFTIIPAIISSFIAFYYINQPRHTWERATVSGFFIGTGITMMHYIGMYVIHFEGVEHSYQTNRVVLSYILAVLLSIVALLIYRYLYITRGHLFSHSIPALLLALVVIIVHYVGMSAMQFRVNADELQRHGMIEPMDMTFISLGISSSVTIIAGLLLATFVVNRVFSHRLEYYDSLTGLPNMTLFTKQLESNFKANAIAAVDFNRMTEGACNYGLLFDEQLLKHIAADLKARLPGLTELYRVSDYTFVIVTQDELATKQTTDILTAYLQELKDGMVFHQQVFKLPAVVMMAKAETMQTFKELYSELATIIDHPSTNYDFSFIYYDPAYHTLNFEGHLLEDLDNALKNGDIFLVYQPKVNPHTNELVSTEALIRWIHPEYGFLAPPVFLGILEEHGRLQYLTDWIIEEVCRQLATWKTEKPVPQVGINIPGPYLTTNRLFAQVVAMTEKYNIERSMIELEITETSIVHSIEEATEAVLKFRDAGFEIALDDFGTGVSSLSYLKQLACSTLKIDKSFVDEILVSEKDRAILEAILTLGKSLHMQIVIEGVEEQEQVDYLIGLSEHLLIQGYYYAKPMKPEALQKWYAQYEVGGIGGHV